MVHGVNTEEEGLLFSLVQAVQQTTFGPIIEIIGRRVNLHKKAILNTTHAYTASQTWSMLLQREPRMGRWAAIKFGSSCYRAANCSNKALPQYVEGKFDGIAGPCTCA